MRTLDAIEIWPARFPVIRIARPDPLVRLEFDEFEGAGAGRMAAQVGGREGEGIYGQIPAGESHQEGWLRPPQMQGNLVIAIGSDRFEISVPGLARIDPELLTRLFGHQVKGALDVL